MWKFSLHTFTSLDRGGRRRACGVAVLAWRDPSSVDVEVCWRCWCGGVLAPSGAGLQWLVVELVTGEDED
ncbi:hypothetical protein RIF29_20160 [Crotalaria pallida]|uniref:Uncharacterized protein n=1 Tax=Crotalaria pallida TaxID=3830 RepID=A0AAN9F213_CROPI